MGDDRKRGSRVLRFAVTGALLVAPMAGCGDDEGEHTMNEPAPEPMVNEVVEPDGPVVPEPVEPTVNAPPEPHPTPNAPAHRNE